mmetsp:Transcript_42126/g.91524  ORF Transcript_42126/g.91524 Transcript_42126/m.91524 type:complete len:283 (-) Transcript_42126:678-1526(-)
MMKRRQYFRCGFVAGFLSLIPSAKRPSDDYSSSTANSCCGNSTNHTSARQCEHFCIAEKNSNPAWSVHKRWLRNCASRQRGSGAMRRWDEVRVYQPVPSSCVFSWSLCSPFIFVDPCCRYQRGTRRQQSGPGTICAVERWLGHSLPAELTRSRRRQTERSSPSTTRDSIRVKLPHAPPCTTTRTVLLYCAEHTRPCHTRPSRHCRHPICTQARFAHAELRPTSPGRTRVPARHTGCTSGGETDHVARPCESQAHLDVASPLGRVASRQVHADDGQGGTRAVV